MGAKILFKILTALKNIYSEPQSLWRIRIVNAKNVTAQNNVNTANVKRQQTKPIVSNDNNELVYGPCHESLIAFQMKIGCRSQSCDKIGTLF